MIFIDSNDYPHIGHLFGSSGVPTPLPGFDILLITRRGPIPIERKEVPHDLIASVVDGRLHREICAMREVSPINIILWHGEMIFQRDGMLLLNNLQKTSWNETGIRNLRRSIEVVNGCYVEEAKTDEELVKMITELQEYFDDESLHGSYRNRPGIESNWLFPTERERLIYFYSGFKDVKTVRAKALAERFPSPEQLINATMNELQAIQGIGAKTATSIFEFLHGKS